MTRRTKSELIAENEELRSRAEEAEETLRAIQSGEVDAIVISTPEGKRVFSLKSAETPYRILMESISEGAVTLTPDGMILYANTRFSEMLGFPLERIIGARFHNFLPGFLKRRLTGLLKRGYRKSAKEESALVTSNGSFLPVYLSARRLALDGRKGL
ncbi:MAG TPA: PAS domain-containing protein, partial [Dissulfurispiraceae bacterium]